MKFLSLSCFFALIGAERSGYIFLPFDPITTPSRVHFDLTQKWAMDETEERRITMSGIIDLDTPLLVLEDVRCGSLRTDCPGYCADDSFAPIFCDGQCQRMTPQKIPAFCTKPILGSYNATLTGGKLLERNCYRRMGANRRWFGELFLDNLEFRGFAGNAISLDPKLPKIAGMKFMSITLWNRIYSQEFGGENLFGLAPGEDNLVAQMMAQKYISHSVVSLARQYREFFRHRNDPYESFITVGRLDMTRCTDWNLHKTNGSWSVVASKIQVNGTFHFKDQLIAFSASDYASQFPPQIQEYYRSSKQHCVDPFSLIITIGNQTLELDATIFRVVATKRFCTHYVRPFGYRDNRDEPPNTDMPQWIFGRSILHRFCIGYDYEKRLLAVGRNRFHARLAVYNG